MPKSVASTSSNARVIKQVRTSVKQSKRVTSKNLPVQGCDCGKK